MDRLAKESGRCAGEYFMKNRFYPKGFGTEVTFKESQN